MSIAFTRAAAALVAAALAALPLVETARAQTSVEETFETLPNFPGREETFGYCVGCHSFSVVGRQGMDRGQWDNMLNWMSVMTDVAEHRIRAEGRGATPAGAGLPALYP